MGENRFRPGDATVNMAKAPIAAVSCPRSYSRALSLTRSDVDGSNGGRAMWGETIIFTLTARPGAGGSEIFRSSLDEIIVTGAGSAVFNAVYLDNSRAVLRGAIMRGRGTTTGEGLAEYLADALAEAGITLDFDLEIAARYETQPAFPGCGSSMRRSNVSSASARYFYFGKRRPARGRAK